MRNTGKLKSDKTLKSGGALGGGGQLIPLKSLSATKRLKARSDKTQKWYAEERIPFVISFLGEHPRCKARWEGCSGVATEVNELVLRSRGGSAVEEENCVGLCHACHLLITQNPKRAHETGFAIKANPSCEEIEWARKKREENE
jgi:hypothetical protein